jgi:hypothetical protein
VFLIWSAFGSPILYGFQISGDRRGWNEIRLWGGEVKFSRRQLPSWIGQYRMIGNIIQGHCHFTWEEFFCLRTKLENLKIQY